MGGGGTSSSGNQFGFQNTTSTYSPDPMAYNYLMGVLNMGANVGGIPYQPYTGQTLAGFTQDQLAAMQGVREAVGGGDHCRYCRVLLCLSVTLGGVSGAVAASLSALEGCQYALCAGDNAISGGPG